MQLPEGCPALNAIKENYSRGPEETADCRLCDVPIKPNVLYCNRCYKMITPV